MLRAITFEDIKIFNGELLILIPPYPQALVLSRFCLLLK